MPTTRVDDAVVLLSREDASETARMTMTTMIRMTAEFGQRGRREGA